MKYNRLSPRQGLGLANFKQWSEGGSSRSRAPVPRYRYRSVMQHFAYVLRSISAAHSISIHFVPTVGWTYQVRPFCWGWNGLPLRYLQECLWLMTFTLKCCPGPEMVCQQSLSRYLLASQDLLFSKLGPFFLSFLSSLVLGQASASVSKTRIPKSKIWPPKVTDKNMKRLQNRLLDPVLFCAFHWISQVPKRPGKKWESSMHGDLPAVVKQD